MATIRTDEEKNNCQGKKNKKQTVGKKPQEKEKVPTTEETGNQDFPLLAGLEISQPLSLSNPGITWAFCLVRNMVLTKTSTEEERATHLFFMITRVSAGDLTST